MFGLFRRSPPTRAELVARGDKARGQGKVKKAIKAYQAALVLEPADEIVHGKLAPLLARANQGDEALKSFEAAADGQLKKGFVDRAIAIWVQAAQAFPLNAESWRRVAQLQVERGRRADGVKALLDGRSHQRKRTERPAAIALLREALALDPALFAPKLDLARTLAKEGQRDEAVALLQPLAEGLSGRPLREVRAAQLAVQLTPGNVGRWIRALVVGR